MKVLSKSMQGASKSTGKSLEIKAFLFVYSRFIFVFINN